MPVDPRLQAALDAPMKPGGNAPRFRSVPGYAGAPGAGPIGETCKSCRHCHPTGSDYRDWFCKLAGYQLGRHIERHKPACHRWDASNG